MKSGSFPIETLVETAVRLTDREAVRPGGAPDAIVGRLPALVVEPNTPEAVAAVLAWASRERLRVVLRGGATKLDWGRRPAPVDLVLSTARLNRVTAHQPGDLTATAEAGTTIDELNRELGRHRQWLPLDSSATDATIGGAIATNDSGPLRHRYGAPRDLLIGVRLATTDGRLVKAGGNVVKNVAGYDLGKLVSGSFGSLAAIVSATFKLAPVPAASSTLVVALRDPQAVADLVAAAAGSQLEPAALDVHALAGLEPQADQAPYRLLVRFASVPPAVEAQMGEARALLRASERADVLSGQSEAALWRAHRDGFWGAPGGVVKLSWRPATLGTLLTLLEDVARAGSATVELMGRAAVGAGLVRLDAETANQATMLARLNSQPDVIGNIVLLRGDMTLREKAVWGPSPDTLKLLRALKRVFDPAGVLNAGQELM